jgi:hypothetical protein
LNAPDFNKTFHKVFMPVSEFGRTALQFPWVRPINAPSRGQISVQKYSQPLTWCGSGALLQLVPMHIPPKPGVTVINSPHVHAKHVAYYSLLIDELALLSALGELALPTEKWSLLQLLATNNGLLTRSFCSAQLLGRQKFVSSIHKLIVDFFPPTLHLLAC